MQPELHFESYAEYLVTLLILLDEIGETQLSEAVRAFETKFGDFIPPKDKKPMKSGKPRWAYDLEWGRYDLNQLGLMASPARGRWALSDDGRTWLKNHGKYDNALHSMKTMLHDKASAWRGDIKKDKHFVFRWQDQELHADAEKLETRALDEIRIDNPPEAYRFRDWYAQIEDKQVSVKWLFHLLTGAGYDEFVTYQAVAILRKLGFDIQKIGGKVQKQQESDTNENKQDSVKLFDLHGDEFEQFISEIKKVLPHSLSAIANHAKINAYPDSKLIQVNFPDIYYAHYEISFRQEDEIAFHFECQLVSLNLERLEQVKPLVESWSNSLGTQIQAEQWGKKRARVSIRLSKVSKSFYGLINFLEATSLTDTTQKGNFFFNNLKAFARQNPDLPFWQQKAHAYAGMMAKFIEVTFPDLQRLFGGNKRRERSTISKSEYGQDSRSHRMLDQKISEIRNFIAGRAIRIPKDDELCDWIQLCYFFELSREGQELFRFVQPQVLNNEWLYRRAKKYADLCRIKAPLIG